MMFYWAMNLMNQEKFLDEALAYAIHGNTDMSESILKMLDQNDPRVKFNLGWHDMRRGSLKKGYEGLFHGRMIDVFGGAKNPYGAIYEKGDLQGKTLLFQNEGGLGDEIINIRFAKKFHEMGAKIVLGCDISLFPIFKHLPHISAMIDRNVSIGCHHDTWVPAMSAAGILGLEYSDLNGEPYLDYFKPRYLPNKKKGIKVGLRWAGNPKFEHEQHRKFPIEKILELSKTEGFTFYSLQRDNDLMELPFMDLRYELKSWQDTAEIIAGLDLIITSCTSIAHLSAAMGKPTWVIVPILPYYIWALPINSSPWYNSVKLYRQTEYGSWNNPFEDISNDLQLILKENKLDVKN